MSRMVGSTFGVAVMGAIVTTVGRSKLDQSLPKLAPAQRSTIVSALGSGSAAHGHASPQILAAVEQAFVSALRSGFVIGAAVTLVSSIAAWVLIERKVAASAAAPSSDQAATPEQTYSR